MKRIAVLPMVFLVVACPQQEPPQPPPPVPVLVPPPAPPPPQEAPISAASSQAVEAFKKGRDLADNWRPTEAIEQLKKAIELDPKFAQAHALLGSITPGPPGLRELEQGAALSAGLPETERLGIEIMLAWKRGEREKARPLVRKR